MIVILVKEEHDWKQLLPIVKQFDGTVIEVKPLLWKQFAGNDGMSVGILKVLNTEQPWKQLVPILFILPIEPNEDKDVQFKKQLFPNAVTPPDKLTLAKVVFLLL